MASEAQKHWQRQTANQRRWFWQLFSTSIFAVVVAGFLFRWAASESNQSVRECMVALAGLVALSSGTVAVELMAVHAILRGFEKFDRTPESRRSMGFLLKAASFVGGYIVAGAIILGIWSI